jgi:ABC-2 type transport system permease protein
MNTRRVKTVVRRHVYVLRRSPHRFFDVTVWPLLDVLLFGSLGAFVAQQDGASKAGAPYLLAGILMFHILYQLQIAICTGFMEETWSRNVLNILTTPVTEAEYILGVALFGLAKLVLAMAALTVMAIAFFGFNLTSVGWGLLPITAVLLLAGWSIGMAVIGLMLRYGQSAEILAWGINFLVMALSGVFNPVDAIPGALQPLSRILPTTHAFSALRTLLDGQPLPWGEIGAGLVGAVVCAAISIWYSARMLRTFRRRGYVTRFS